MAALALLAGAALLVIAALLLRPAAAPTGLLIEARAALNGGNAGAARLLAARAVARDRRLAIGQALLARIALAQDDAIGADVALRRAVDAGIDPAMLHHLRAEALVLEGDADGARAEAAQAVPPYYLYAARIAARARALSGDRMGARSALRTLAQTRPNDGPAWLDLARLCYGMGRSAEADTAVRHALALMPADPGALTLMGNLVRRREGLAAAMPWYDRALASDPAYFPALADAAATAGDLGHYRAMLALTRRALAVRPGSAQPVYLQAILAARASKVRLARDLVTRTGGALDGVPGMMLLAGSVAYADGRYQEAVSRWSDLMVAQPANLTARRLLGEALLAAGDPAGAVDALRPLTGAAGADRATLMLAARAAAAVGDAAGATTLRQRARRALGAGGARSDIASLAAGISAVPGDAGRAVEQVRAMLAKGDTGEAVASARTIAAQDPDAAPAQVALGDALLAANDSAGAVTAYRAAAAIVFDEPTMLRLAAALGRAGQPRAVVAMVDRYRAANPASLAALRLAGHWRLAAGDPAGALPLLRQVLARGGADAPLRIDVALADADTGHVNEARREAVTAYAQAPRNRAVIAGDAALLVRLGDAAGAARLNERARRLGPAQP